MTVSTRVVKLLTARGTVSSEFWEQWNRGIEPPIFTATSAVLRLIAYFFGMLRRGTCGTAASWHERLRHCGHVVILFLNYETLITHSSYLRLSPRNTELGDLTKTVAGQR
ncbi:hypothetical protein B0H13DRAFT_1867849 [Mycena leptocephala]|nr:hypothetical protein B0H13DRAFT_1867849 [Mycena leptocephala]